MTGTSTVLVYNSHHSGQLAAKSFKLSKYIPTQDTSSIEVFFLGSLCIVLNRAGIRNGTKENSLFYFTTDFKGSGCVVSRKMYKCTLKWKKLDKQKLSSRNVNRKLRSLSCNTCFLKKASHSVLSVLKIDSQEGSCLCFLCHSSVKPHS